MSAELINSCYSLVDFRPKYLSTFVVWQNQDSRFSLMAGASSKSCP